MTSKILLVDDEHEIIDSLTLALKRQYEVKGAYSVESAQQLILSESFDVIVTDLKFHGQPLDGLDLLNWLNAKNIPTPVIVLSGEADVGRVLSVQRRIDDDYLTKPIELPDLFCAIEKAKARVAANEPKGKRQFHEVVTQDSRILEGLDDIKLLMQSDSIMSLCIRGESGSGKEELAKFAASVRGGPLVTLNMAKMPKELEASELFGHVRGAFTGATSDRIGKFQAASGGVLFLDEIGDCPMDLQVKLFRVLEERKLQKVGGNVVESFDTKIIFATNLDLQKLVKENKFREELLWRINGMTIEIPPLRCRKDDIPLLVGKFLSNLSPKARPATISADALRALHEYSWPGNVRELKTIIEKALFRAKFREIDVQHLEPVVFGVGPTPVAAPVPTEPDDLSLDKAVTVAETIAFKKAIEKANGSKKKAMQLLDVTESTFFRKLKELKLFSSPGASQCDLPPN